MTHPASASTGQRRPYHGSCHCGATRYLVYLTLPPVLSTPTATAADGTVRTRKCSCTTCQKMSFFHIRVPFAPGDFVLLAPLPDPLTQLGDYTCFDGFIHWLFCKTCGVRCFAFAGHGEMVPLDSASRLADDVAHVPAQPYHRAGGDGCVQQQQQQKQVWRPRKEGWVEGVEGGTSYLSVNAATLDPGQDGLDLREWHEKGWIVYLDGWEEKEESCFGKPHVGGMY
ncbi:hypothetical protein HDU88_004763 [Geranomyces variabilis]|nr:hypothetical protein HDU88_004763 [Geranomyces variabilis]